MASRSRIFASYLKIQTRRNFGYERRGYCSQKVPSLKTPLSKPLPGFQSPKYDVLSKEPTETRVSTLDNGLRVATENKPGTFCTLGVLIDSGSRYEVHHPSGISHFLEKLAFGATDKYPNREAIMESLENVSGICDAQSSRDTLIYAVSAGMVGAEQAVDILGQIILRPSITEEELEITRQAIAFELESLENTPEPTQYMQELYHNVAYRDNTLGLPKYTPVELIPTISRTDLLSYMRSYHTPDRMVLAGVGIEHEHLVDLAKKYFLNTTPVWEQETSGSSDVIVDTSLSQYTGGLITVEKDMSVFAHGPAPMPDLVHLVLGLESTSHKDDDFVAFCVVQSLLGGGGSFSAGGPGKGMYTRLYTHALNRYGFLWSATAQNHAYNDGGTLCIHSSGDPSSLREMLEVSMRQLVELQHGADHVELSRAKKQLQSLVFMNLEHRPVMFEDIGRQVLANGMRHTAKYYSELIDNVTSEDIKRVARRMLNSPPSVAVLGNISSCPSYEDIRTALRGNGSLPKRFSLFT